MKILSATQIREIDAYTIAHEPVASIDLMERAASAFTDWFTDWFTERFTTDFPIKVVCGLGNNGGDGLAIARLLHEGGYKVQVIIIRYADKTSEDFAANLAALPADIIRHEVRTGEEMPILSASNSTPDIIIDALFGSGLTRPVEGWVASIIEKINVSELWVVAVDIPSGLFVDAPTTGTAIVQAAYTISFQLPKLAFLLPQNADFVGEWHLVHIGLHPAAIEKAQTSRFYTDEWEARALLRPRQKFAHKGTHGHALLVVGSYGMMGAAILAARACLRAGAGKVTVHSPKSGNDIMQISVPEVLFWAGWNSNFVDTVWEKESLEGFAAIGIGPGLGVHGKITESIGRLVEHCGSMPLVLDADALNNLSTQQGRAILQRLPPNSILTPHPKEFQKLLGQSWRDDYEKLDLLQNFAASHKVIICLKGAHTAVALPDGTIHFNSTGNPGMATGGTGDVLTGILTALLAQGYSPAEAAKLGVYLHGAAGDAAAIRKTTHAMIASDLIEYLPAAFHSLLA